MDTFKIMIVVFSVCLLPYQISNAQTLDFDDYDHALERDLEILRDEINDMQHEEQMEALREQTEEIREQKEEMRRLREEMEDLND